MSCEYLLRYLFEIGPAMSGGMGPVPITHLDLRAWQENMAIRLPPWECRAICRLSRAWISESHRAEEPSCKSPLEMMREAPPEMRKATADTRDALRSLAAL